MYYAHWIFAIVSALTGEQSTGDATREVPMTRVECETYLTAHEAAMPGYFVGYEKEEPGSEILVLGSCIPVPGDEKGL